MLFDWRPPKSRGLPLEQTETYVATKSTGEQGSRSTKPLREVERPKTSFEERSKAFLQYKETHPNATFAEFRAARNVERMAQGKPTRQLGPNLMGWDDWRQAGAGKAKGFLTRFSIKPESRVIDYGCGTLRIGVHFINYLNPGCYFGMDVTPDYTKIGMDMIGEDLIREKRPRLSTIDDANMTAATEFGADFVCSISVCTHVHPDEAATYFGNMSRLTWKPGAVLFFTAVVGERTASHRAFALPLDGYIAALPDLKFIKFHSPQERDDDGVRITLGTFEFRRNKG